MNVVDRYAQSVVRGDLPGGKYHRLACARHLKDRAREGTTEFPYVFDLPRAERFFRFAGRVRHYKGEWAGRLVELSDCQRFRLGSVFGWVRAATGLRRFRKAYNELPRKQGKSLEAGIVADYTTFFDGEPGAEGYCAATKRDQARIVFNDAKALVESSSELRSRISVLGSNLSHARTRSKLEPLSADHNSMDGLNPHLVIVDELHAHKDRGLIDVLETAMGARRQPLMYEITTAGDDPVSPCGDEHDYACKILDGVIDDESFFAFIAHADLEDDWLSEATWRKANPHYGMSVNPEDMRALATKAKNMPAAAAAFKQKRLNLWVNSAQPWLSLEGWRKGQSKPAEWTAADLLHEPCWVGIDLASKIDLLAMVFVFPPTPGRANWRLLRWVWTPGDTVLERERRDRAPYTQWVEQGHLRTTPGTRVDHQVIRQVLSEERKRFDIEAIGFDPWHADTLIDQLVHQDGFPESQVLAVPQTYAGMGSAAKRFEADVLAGDFDAQGDPLMQWSVSNAVAQRDGKDNIYPVKKKSRGRIDPVMATLIALALYLRQPVQRPPAYQMIVLGGGR